MKALHFGQKVIVIGKITILNDFKHRLTTNDKGDHFSLSSNSDYVMVGSAVQGEIIVGQDQHFDINGLHR